MGGFRVLLLRVSAGSFVLGGAMEAFMVKGRVGRETFCTSTLAPRSSAVAPHAPLTTTHDSSSHEGLLCCYVLHRRLCGASWHSACPCRDSCIPNAAPLTLVMCTLICSVSHDRSICSVSLYMSHLQDDVAIRKEAERRDERLEADQRAKEVSPMNMSGDQ